MTDLEYLSHAESVLAAVEATCDRLNERADVDIDNQRSGGMLTLTFADHSQIVINLQKPLQEIWLASQKQAYHYKFNSGKWLSTKGQSEFFADLSRDASVQAGQVLGFAASAN